MFYNRDELEGGEMPRFLLFYHITWSTKYRQPFINDDNREIIFKSIIAKSVELGVGVLAVNGMEDHIHLLVSTSPSLAPSVLIGQIKGVSSHLIRSLGWKDFKWGKEYSIRAISEEDLSKVIVYIKNQQIHHSK